LLPSGIVPQVRVRGILVQAHPLSRDSRSPFSPDLFLFLPLTFSLSPRPMIIINSAQFPPLPFRNFVLKDRVLGTISLDQSNGSSFLFSSSPFVRLPFFLS